MQHALQHRLQHGTHRNIYAIYDGSQKFIDTRYNIYCNKHCSTHRYTEHTCKDILSVMAAENSKTNAHLYTYVIIRALDSNKVTVLLLRFWALANMTLPRLVALASNVLTKLH